MTRYLFVALGMAGAWFLASLSATLWDIQPFIALNVAVVAVGFLFIGVMEGHVRG